MIKGREIRGQRGAPIPTPIRPVIFPAYDPESIALMAEMLRRASRDGPVDEAALERDLLDVVHATGAAVRTPKRRPSGMRKRPTATWRSRGNSCAWPMQPIRSTLPFARGALRPELNGMIHNRWSARWRREGRGDHASIRSISWETLTDREQAEIREMARTLSCFHKSMAPAHRPPQG